MIDTKSKNSLASSGDRLKHLRAILRISRAYIQEKYRIPEVTLKSWENGNVQLTEAAVKRCVEVFRREGLIVSENWIVRGEGLDPTSTATLNRYFVEPVNSDSVYEDDEVCMIRDANAFKQAYSNAIVLIVSNEEMRPFYKPGDYVGGKILKRKDIKKTANKDCIVSLKTGAIHFRRVVINESGKINLTCLNPNIDTKEPVMFDVEIEKIAPIIWHRWKDE